MFEADTPLVLPIDGRLTVWHYMAAIEKRSGGYKLRIMQIVAVVMYNFNSGNFIMLGAPRQYPGG